MRFFLRLIALLLLLVVLALAALRGIVALGETQARDAALPAEGRLVDTALGRIYVEETGPADGPVVLLVHGSIGWSRLWAETQGALAAAGWRSIAFDLPPMGFSDRTPGDDYSRQHQADRIRALAAALGVRPVLVAHSVGAGPAAEAAMADPAAFAGLVVICGAIGLGEDGTGQSMPLPLRPRVLRETMVAATATNPFAMGFMLRMFVHRKEAATPGVIAVLRRPMALRGTTAALADWLPSLMVPPAGALSTTEAGWRDLAVPLALIWGAEDTATPPAQGEAIARITGAPMTVLSAVGHIPQIEDPAAFDAALAAALEPMR